MSGPENPRVMQADWDAAFAFERMVGGADTSLLSTCFARHREAAEAASKAREAALVEALRSLEYWFDTDPEILDALTDAERADNARQLAKIRAAISCALGFGEGGPA